MSRKLTSAVLALLCVMTLGGCRKERDPLTTPDQPVGSPVAAGTAEPTAAPAASEEPEVQKFANMTGFGLPGDQKVFMKSDMKTVGKKVENGENFALFIGHENCEWCRKAVPVLKQAADDLGTTVEYVDISDDSTWRTEDQKKGYDTFIEMVSDRLETDEDGEKALYVPFVVFFRNGKVVDSHISTLDNDTSDAEELTDEQKGQLKQIYYTGFIRAGI